MNEDSVSSYRSSVSDWLDSVKHGSDSAARKIWERYVEQLVREAKRQLARNNCGLSDGDDIAQEAFAGFFCGIQEGRFSQMHDRDDLWQILIVLANRRATDCRRREWAMRRSGPVRDGTAKSNGADRNGNAKFRILLTGHSFAHAGNECSGIFEVDFPQHGFRQVDAIDAPKTLWRKGLF